MKGIYKYMMQASIRVDHYVNVTVNFDNITFDIPQYKLFFISILILLRHILYVSGVTLKSISIIIVKK